MPAPEGWLGAGAGGGPWNLVLITCDTTRRDHLSCYGCKEPTTPHIDGLAARGILFENAVSPVPITLPAHTTILTGLDPPEHGVRDNNAFVLSGAYTTVAEVLALHGFATGATLGAFPVDKRFGLNQGFSTYDDDFGYGGALAGLRMSQRNAKEVTDKALAWIEGHKKGPFFHWAHYFDPHFPYEPPEEFRRRFALPYDGEIAFMDREIGRLAAGLERLGLIENTWILLAADHGESLDEHGELNHSMLIYGATQSVPCIIAPPKGWHGLPKEKIRGRRIKNIVRLRDLAPTMLDALGVVPEAPPGEGAAAGGAPLPFGLLGPSLLDLAAGAWDGAGHAYTETLAPWLEYGWSDLRGVRTPKWSYIRAPERELYDLTADPGERRNVLPEHPSVAARLDALLDSLTQNEVELETRRSDPETLAKLRGLGYAAVPVGHIGTKSGKDPKTLMHVVDLINDARTALGASKAEEAKSCLDEALEEDPGNPEAARLLITVLLCLGNAEGAEKACNEHLSLYPGDEEVLLDKAQAQALAKDYDGAIETLKSVLAADAGNKDAADLLPRLLVSAGRAGEARSFLEEGVKNAPGDAAPLVRYGFFDLYQGDLDAARSLAEKAVAADPDAAGGQTLLGEILFNETMAARKNAPGSPPPRGLPDAVRRRFEKALHKDPLDSLAAFRLGCHDHETGKLEKARDLFQAALVRRPNWPEAHARLGDILWRLKDYKAGLRHYKIAESLGFDNPGFLLNYGIALALAGLRPEAVTVWEKALAGTPSPALAAKLRHNIEKLKESLREKP